MARRSAKRRHGWKTHYLRWLMALRRTKKEVWLENTLPKVIVGSKAHLKEVWLENTLPKVVGGSKAH